MILKKQARRQHSTWARYLSLPYLGVGMFLGAVALRYEGEFTNQVTLAMAGGIFFAAGIFLTWIAPQLNTPKGIETGGNFDTGAEEIECSTITQALAQWILSAFLVTLGGGFCIFGYFSEDEVFQPFGVFSLGIAIILLVLATIGTVRWRKFGKSILKFTHKPCVGGELKGTIFTRNEVSPTDDFSVGLYCYESITTGSGKNKKTKKHTRWKEEKSINGKAYRSKNGIPVSFAIPGDAMASFDERAEGGITWELKISAPTPGINYNAQFDVTVRGGGEEDAPE